MGFSLEECFWTLIVGYELFWEVLDFDSDVLLFWVESPFSTEETIFMKGLESSLSSSSSSSSGNKEPFIEVDLFSFLPEFSDETCFVFFTKENALVFESAGNSGWLSESSTTIFLITEELDDPEVDTFVLIVSSSVWTEFMRFEANLALCLGFEDWDFSASDLFL